MAEVVDVPRLPELPELSRIGSSGFPNDFPIPAIPMEYGKAGTGAGTGSET